MADPVLNFGLEEDTAFLPWVPQAGLMADPEQSQVPVDELLPSMHEESQADGLSHQVTPLRINLSTRRVSPLRINLSQISQPLVPPLRINRRDLHPPRVVSPLRINRSRLHSTILDPVEDSPAQRLSPLRISRIQTLQPHLDDPDVSIVHGDDTVEIIPGNPHSLVFFPKYSILGTPELYLTGRRKRPRAPSPEQRLLRQRQREPGPSNLPTVVERTLIDNYAGLGISGDRKIAISDAVNADNRVPDEIKNLGHAMVKMYIDARIKKIEEHNAHVLECVQQDTMDLREATRGWGLVVCPECMEDVPWGSIMLHRTGLCKNCRV